MGYGTKNRLPPQIPRDDIDQYFEVFSLWMMEDGMVPLIPGLGTSSTGTLAGEVLNSVSASIATMLSEVHGIDINRIVDRVDRAMQHWFRMSSQVPDESMPEPARIQGGKRLVLPEEVHEADYAVEVLRTFTNGKLTTTSIYGHFSEKGALGVWEEDLAFWSGILSSLAGWYVTAAMGSSGSWRASCESLNRTWRAGRDAIQTYR